MRALTRGIGSGTPAAGADLSPAAAVRILISRPNHRLGNLLLVSPLLQEICTAFPNARIDLFVKGSLPSTLYGAHPQVDRILELPRKPFRQLGKYLACWLRLRGRRYDLVINVDGNSSSGRLSTRFCRSRYRIFGELPEGPDKADVEKHIARRPVYAFRNFLTGTGIKSATEVPNLDLRLKPEELAAGKLVVEGLVSRPDRKTICLFSFATGSKCYAREWWAEFYELLEENFPEYNFIEVLPIENISNLAFRLPSFYSRDVRELASVIANTAVFIGADSGIMHLASAVQVPTVGLFCVSDMEKYMPYGPGSLGIDTNRSSKEESVQMIREVLELEGVPVMG